MKIRTPDLNRMPKLSIIIPSFNQGLFLEETLLSILHQNYPELELIVIDGGSTDNSVDIIRKYASSLAFWVSEPDHGQSHAINKGLEKATGDWVAWMNSDDCYLPGAFDYVFRTRPWQDMDFIFGNTCYGKTIDTSTDFIHDPAGKNNLKNLLKFCYSIEHIVPSQSVFIRRSILQKTGLLDENIHYCMDFDWYCRIYLVTNRILYYPKTISFFRSQPHSKTGSRKNNGSAEAMEIAEKYLVHLPEEEQNEVKKTLAYMRDLLSQTHSGIPGLWKFFRMAIQYGNIAINHISFKVAIKRQVRSMFGSSSERGVNKFYDV